MKALQEWLEQYILVIYGAVATLVLLIAGSLVVPSWFGYMK